MGIKEFSWEDELITALSHIGAETEFLPSATYRLLKFKDSDQLIIHLISIHHPYSPEALVALAQNQDENRAQVIHLWEDIWRTRSAQVLSRITSILGKNVTVYGRKTKIVEVTQPEADEFYNRYHLQGTAGCKYRYALVNGEGIIAIAGFSAKRRMTQQPGEYYSVELIRFATINGITVTGGLSKLIRHFIKVVQPNDVMSYADLDWSRGKGYLKLGFTQVSVLPPMQIFLNLHTLERFFLQRLPREIKAEMMTLQDSERDVYLRQLNYIPIYNTGNLKYILYL
ncbi:hypothetical protein [Pedobacter sp. MR2016-24]|uniref:hypothetical protein n=1 Tax=Pedobacter sp. MR2016-24 TaxID=2994466 RepID=UPI0022471F99|nr:hypothetical protein [Pedobacter sp. MR2016-24]MCX2485875.1 hypothetical protein [Pedobacter sp. MR2016-24]